MEFILSGKLSKITSPIEMAKAVKLLYLRIGGKPSTIKKFMNKFPRRLYKFVPKKVWINDEGEKK